MLLSEARKLFKEKGYKIRTKSLSFGRHAEILNSEGEKLPSIFMGADEVNKWGDAILLKKKVYPVFDDNSSDKVYGFGEGK